MKRKFIIHTGISGFPVGSAAINKCIAVYKILTNNNFNVTVINNRAVHNPSIPVEVLKKSNYDGINYLYTTPTPYRQNTFFKRRLYNFLGKFNELCLISKLAFKNQLDLIIYYPTGKFFDLVLYWIIARVFSVKIISHYVEYRTSFENIKYLRQRINYKLFDKYFINFVDGVLPISEFLIDHLISFKNTKPYFKIPPLADYSLFKTKNKQTSNNYFMFAGSAAYENIINIILESFKLLKPNDFKLILLLSGDLERINKQIHSHPKSNRIIVRSSVPYSELINLYCGANALLIPLGNNIQDRARFPQKISEYLATGNPMITTNIGEIKYYFKDLKNALVAQKFDSNDIAEKMQFVVDNPVISKKIGKQGYLTGLNFFNISAYEKSLPEFIEKVI